ncbi:hypothetical protein [Pedobacter gandavensis]|uniref:hypothetical protein n=1 Tax=Pedobacter gandavensis TaxID=2679963 RepID=UPI00292FB41D|nr:hypothetical protein [Pedobacter gandavensis]
MEMTLHTIKQFELCFAGTMKKGRFCCSYLFLKDQNVQNALSVHERSKEQDKCFKKKLSIVCLRMKQTNVF